MTIHLLANADFTNYQYHEVYIPAGVSATVNGTTLPATSDDVTLPIGVNTSTNNSGAFFLVGKLKPEYFKDANGNYPFLGK